jgi:hypothetical protein
MPAEPTGLLQNKLLAALPLQAQQELFPHLKQVDLPLGKVLYESGDAPINVFSPPTPSFHCCT